MKKNDFLNGDIIMQRDGALGFYFDSQEVIIYQTAGYDSMDTFNDDLTSNYDSDCDIMRVYRADGGVISFLDYEEGDLIYERDETWESPKHKEQHVEKPEIIPVKKDNNFIWIVAQAFYGNRMNTEIRIEDMDAFILGHLDGHLRMDEKIDRTIVRIPGSDDVVFVYNEFKEESVRNEMVQEREEGYIRKPLASIPEQNIEIFSRCIACRMNDAGEFGSLMKEDYEKFLKYLAD